MNKLYLITGVVFLYLCACNPGRRYEYTEEVDHKPYTIDIRNVKYSNIPQMLSSFVDSIEYIRIEEEPLIPDLWNVHIAEDDTGNIYLDFAELFKYDSTGKFIKPLFKKGNGPGEIIAKNERAVYDMKKELVYVPNVGVGYNLYTLDGEFVERIDNRLGTFNRNLIAFWNNCTVSYLYDNKFPQKGESVNMDSTFFLQVHKRDKIVYQLPNWNFDVKSIYPGRGVVEYPTGSVLTGSVNDSLFWMKPLYVDTVYCATGWDDVRIFYIIQKSDRAADYDWSVRARVGNITKTEAFKEMLGPVCSLKSGLLFSYSFNKDKQGVGFCPANGKCNVISRYFKNDIDEYCPTLDLYKIVSYGTYFQKNNYLYILVDAFKFLEEGTRSPFTDLKEDSNPILVKLRLK